MYFGPLAWKTNLANDGSTLRDKWIIVLLINYRKTYLQVTFRKPLYSDFLLQDRNFIIEHYKYQFHSINDRSDIPNFL